MIRATHALRPTRSLPARRPVHLDPGLCARSLRHIRCFDAFAKEDDCVDRWKPDVATARGTSMFEHEPMILRCTVRMIAVAGIALILLLLAARMGQ